MRTLRSKICLLFALSLFLAGFFLVFSGFSAPVWIILPSRQAEDQTLQLMDALVQGDLEAIGSQLYGQSDFRLVDEHTNAINSILWDHYISNVEYAFSGGCYGTPEGLARDVEIQVPDLAAILSQVEERYRLLLDEGLTVQDETAADPGRYQRMVLETALDQVISEAPARTDKAITLKLIHHQGQWWVLPEAELLRLLSGDGIF